MNQDGRTRALTKKNDEVDDALLARLRPPRDFEHLKVQKVFAPKIILDSRPGWPDASAKRFR